MTDVEAPIGYPLIIPRINGKEPHPLTLNIGFIIFEKKRLKQEANPSEIKRLLATKKGNKDGMTTFKQSFRAFWAETIETSGIRTIFKII